MALLISGPLVEAVRLFLSQTVGGYNSIVTALGQAALTVDWTKATSKQYFELNAEPDDFEESTPFKYPMVFLYSATSNNEHEQYGTDFSGKVQLMLKFYVSNKSSSLAVAGRALEVTGNVIESAVNTLFGDGNWPQSYGATAVMASYPMTRERLQPDGEEWRQGFIFRLTFEATAS